MGRTDGRVVAVADPHPEPRQKIATAIAAERQYDDYRLMLAEEQLDIVVIATRWTEEHYDMASAALKAGAHIFMEKPFVHVLAGTTPSFPSIYPGCP